MDGGRGSVPLLVYPEGLAADAAFLFVWMPGEGDPAGVLPIIAGAVDVVLGAGVLVCVDARGG